MAENKQFGNSEQLDTISRAAAIDALADYIHNVDMVYSTGKLTHEDCVDAAHSVLDKLPSAQQWIPCSERLPKVREWVLCQCRAGIMDVLRLTGDGIWNKNYPHAEYMGGFVIAWMPLPDTYKKGESDG